MMPAAKPIAGYPSRTAAVVALRAQGLTAEEVARRLGVSQGTVYALESSARRRVGSPLRLPADVSQMLEDPASRRGLTVTQLALKIVATVARDGMVEAVLDDGEEADG